MTCEAPEITQSDVLLSLWKREENRLCTTCTTREPATIRTTITMLSEMRSIWPQMYGHCVRSASIARCMADRIEYLQEETDALTIATLLHDYGKTTLHDRFFLYDSLSLTEQYELRVAHVRKGFDAIRTRIDEPVARIMVAHHEFPQPACESYPRDKTKLKLFYGNELRNPPR